MRRRRLQVGPQRGSRASLAAIHEQIAVADARLEFPLGGQIGEVSHQPAVRGREQFAALLRRDVAGGEVLHQGVARAAAVGAGRARTNRHQVASHGPVVGPERDPLSRRFERRTAGEIGERVVAHQAHARHLRAWRQAVGHVVGQADAAAGGEGIHGGRAGRLEGRLPAKRRLRSVSRTVWNHDHVFHSVVSLLLIQRCSANRSQVRLKPDSPDTGASI